MDTQAGLPRRPGEIRHTPSQGIPKATPREGTPVRPPGAPIPPDAPQRPIVHGAPAPQTPPRVWGTPPQPPPEHDPRATVRDARPERGERNSTTGPMGVHETSGVQVRLGSRERERQRQARRRAGRRGGLVAAGVLAVAGLVTAGLVLTPGSGGDSGSDAAAAGGQPAGAGGELPPAGPPITIGTADGSRYRIATVTSGVSEGVVTTFQSTPPSGTSFPYIEYILSNPSDQKVLLDFPGDVFVKGDLVAPNARGRCMPQAGVPEAMCTPPTRSQVVRRLSGGALIPGEGGDKYIPPGAAYLVRATVDVPVDQNIKRSDMGLYVWKQLYMADQLAKQAPFPNGR
ncbi:hypothetical protein LUX33_35420 [Actinomadura madurae]|uniref:hypothetical protein n=1 Tax=Actinomadura madurae TaxID=1993 RepID=UPI0020D25584|nr:hypothetical protein [Actinomadura madurae]MCP9953213.1 hypothetical protein [Actinomadura madurae]